METKTLLVSIDYVHDGRWTWDTRNKEFRVEFDPKKDDIHKIVKDYCESTDGMEIVFNGKPRGNIFEDKNEQKVVGYWYRGKHFHFDRGMTKPKKNYWNVWVKIEVVEQFECVVV